MIMEVSELLITTTLVLQVWLHVAASQKYHQECSAWQNVSSILNRADDQVVMRCNYNSQCTGTDCYGIYQYQQLLPYKKKDIQFCFGVALHPCRKPTELHFYVETPHDQNHFQQNVSSHSDQSYNTGIGMRVNGLQSTLFIQVKANLTLRNHKSYMEIQMRSKVRITLPIGQDQWPESHKKLLIPLMLVPIPECDRNVVTPNNLPGTCSANNPLGTVPPTYTVPPFTVSPGKLAKKCEMKNKDGLYNAHPCGEGEMCDEESFCVCMTGYHRINDTCRPGHDASGPYIIDDLPVSGVTKSTTTIIIAVVVAVVAFLGMLAVGFFIVKYRKYRARYGNHSLLNEDDQNSPDDPLDEDVEDDPPLDLST